MELEVVAEDFDYACRRGRCVLRLVLDPGVAASLLEQLGAARGCFLEELVEAVITVEDFDYDCRRGIGCLLRLELSEHEARRLRSRLASLCL